MKAATTYTRTRYSSMPHRNLMSWREGLRGSCQNKSHGAHTIYATVSVLSPALSSTHSATAYSQWPCLLCKRYDVQIMSRRSKMQASNAKANERQLSKLTCLMGIFHCLVLVQKHNVSDGDTASVISGGIQGPALETLCFLREKR